MSIFSDIDNRIIDEKYIQVLKDENIGVKSDVIDRAKSGDAEAIHTIGCGYAAKGKRNMAILWLGTSSAMGFHQSQLKLGDVFANFDPEVALGWYRRAQKNGIKVSHLDIGEILYSAHKYKEAEEEFKKAANLGDPQAQNRLGVYYSVSKYGPQNRYSPYECSYTIQPKYSLALKWFQKAADQNYPKAQYHIGELYEHGRGVDSDQYKAIEWYQKSKDGGFMLADVLVKKINKEGYFYIPQKKVYSSNTAAKSEVCDSKTDADSFVVLPKEEN